MTTFHPDGRLELCWLVEHEEIDGVPCARTTAFREILGAIIGRPDSGVRFHPDGSLESCKLSRDFEDLDAGQRIQRDPLAREVSW
jgi:hypothetical protein